MFELQSETISDSKSILLRIFCFHQKTINSQKKFFHLFRIGYNFRLNKITVNDGDTYPAPHHMPRPLPPKFLLNTSSQYQELVPVCFKI